jgi:hypothetical protein
MTGFRRMSLTAAILVLIQAAIGMVVNLYVTIPAHHPGARPANYFTGSANSVAWAITHGAPALAIHATLGLALAVMVIGVAVRAFAVAGWTVRAWSILGALLVIGAGFNGASFLDFNHHGPARAGRGSLLHRRSVQAAGRQDALGKLADGS